MADTECDPGIVNSSEVDDDDAEIPPVSTNCHYEGAEVGSKNSEANIGGSWKNVLSEKEVGISLNIGKYNKVIGIVKERFSDFHVHEIDPDGNITRLTSFDLPANARCSIAPNDPALSKWIDTDTISKLQDLQEADNRDSKSETVEIAVTNMNKEERTKVHRWLVNFDKLVSETIEKSGQKYIAVKHRTKDNSNFTRRPANRARYTHCILYKEGIETSDAISFLARKLRLNPNLITYAGTKDKRAKSTQRLCISNMDAKRLLDVNQCSVQTKLGNFSYSPKRISLGDLKGNHFRILVKNIQCQSTDIDLELCIENSVESLRKNGFINYYGLQRFGSYKISTYAIGKALLQMKWETVFDLILDVKPKDLIFMKQAKRAWLNHRNAQRAKDLIPEWHRSIESNLIHGLAKYYDSRDYLSVLSQIPRNVRMLYIHSFQSYIWNHLVTYRLEEYGLKPVVGDLVYVNPELNSCWNEDLDFDDVSPNSNESDMTDITSTQNNSGRQIYNKMKPEVKTITEENLQNYSIFDVLLPLDGADIKYPNNKVKDYAAKLLLEAGVPIDYIAAFNSKSDTPRGAYRKIVVPLANVSHKIIEYNDKDSLDSMIPSDIDLLAKNYTSPVNEPASNGNSKDKKCLQIEFSLPASSYATMALRELLVSVERQNDISEVSEQPLPEADAAASNVISCSDEVERKRKIDSTKTEPEIDGKKHKLSAKE